MGGQPCTAETAHACSSSFLDRSQRGKIAGCPSRVVSRVSVDIMSRGGEKQATAACVSRSTDERESGQRELKLQQFSVSPVV